MQRIARTDTGSDRSKKKTALATEIEICVSVNRIKIHFDLISVSLSTFPRFPFPSLLFVFFFLACISLTRLLFWLLLLCVVC